jgi:hypothetical protein
MVSNTSTRLEGGAKAVLRQHRHQQVGLVAMDLVGQRLLLGRGHGRHGLDRLGENGLRDARHAAILAGARP